MATSHYEFSIPTFESSHGKKYCHCVYKLRFVTTMFLRNHGHRFCRFPEFRPEWKRCFHKQWNGEVTIFACFCSPVRNEKMVLLSKLSLRCDAHFQFPPPRFFVLLNPRRRVEFSGLWCMPFHKTLFSPSRAYLSQSQPTLGRHGSMSLHVWSCVFDTSAKGFSLHTQRGGACGNADQGMAPERKRRL